MWLRNIKEPKGQLARWLKRLKEFQFEVVHRKGKVHCNADAMSHISSDQLDNAHVTVVNPWGCPRVTVVGWCEICSC